MSNDKHAYGWVGHIITSVAETESDTKHNVVAIPRLTFERLVSDHESGKLDERIQAEQLGLLANGEVYYMACGYAFSCGYQYYGTIFDEAEMLEGGNNAVSRVQQASEYMKAMKEIYGLDLPPALLMIGCSSEH